MFKNRKMLTIGMVSSSFYVAAQIFANILSTKIALLPILNLAVDGGTIIYPLTFTLRDFVHKAWGKILARQIIIIAAFLNLVMFALFWLVGKMTPDPAWNLQESYELILLPVGRIILASISAQIISELIDTEIFSFIYKKTNDIIAVLISNFIGLLFDSIIFSLIAFFGVLPIVIVAQIVISNILIKLVVSLIIAPGIKLIPRSVNFEEIYCP
jgi:uncharacterized integral membrane protein (TIGR00697 family)